MSGELVPVPGGEAPLVPEEQRVAFLEYIEEHPRCSIREACERISGYAVDDPPSKRRLALPLRKQFRQLIALEPQFGEQYREARGYGQDQIRQEIKRRAIDGVERPVFQGGKEVGTVREHSDRLLALMAKAHLPEYGDHATIEVRGTGGGAILQEDRSAKLADVYAELKKAYDGAYGDGDVVEDAEFVELGGGDASGDVPDVGDVLAEPSAGEQQTGGVPPP